MRHGDLGCLDPCANCAHGALCGCAGDGHGSFPVQYGQLRGQSVFRQFQVGRHGWRRDQPRRTPVPCHGTDFSIVAGSLHVRGRHAHVHNEWPCAALNR
jgi:hypothetical protein